MKALRIRGINFALSEKTNSYGHKLLNPTLDVDVRSIPLEFYKLVCMENAKLSLPFETSFNVTRIYTSLP